MSEPSALLDFIRRYGPPAGEEGPVRMVKEVFGIDPDPWQVKTLNAFGRGERRISIRACHGPGKTALAAWCIINQLLTRFPQKTVATAPSSSQLKGALMPEVKMWVKKMPLPLQELFDVKAEGIYLLAAPESSYLEARTARQESPEALAGVHSDHVLLIADEASGVPEAIFEAAAGSMSGHNATTMLLGNPIRTSGFFFDTHHKLSDMWFTVHVGFKDSPRVTQDFADDLARRYGEKSNAYRVRVLGEFPLGDLDKIIPYEWIESARQRDVIVPPNPVEVWGLDVARFGDDSNALVRRNRLSVHPEILTWEGRDLMQTAGRVKAIWDRLQPHERPESILVDSIGMGGGVVDRLRELSLPVRGINVSETDSVDPLYRNLRAELWYTAAEWLGMKDRSLPAKCVCDHCEREPRDDHAQQLATELSIVGFDYTSNGKLIVEDKRQIKKNGHGSPNIADAFVLTFAGEPTTLLRGSSGNNKWGSNWNEPITRNRVMV